MRKEIRIYLEGGGNKASRIELRKAFGEFLRELRDRARNRGMGFRPEPFGSRQRTFVAFKTAVKSRPDAFNVLLVDSEGLVSTDSPWEHLKFHSGDNWDNPGVDDRRCHLMVQVMEAWLIADRDTLRAYYGAHFQEKSLPSNPNVEEIAKETLVQALSSATRKTQKGPYHKTKHAPEILRMVSPSKVRRNAPHCNRLFDTLAAEIDAIEA